MERLVIRVNNIPTIVTTGQLYYLEIDGALDTLEGTFVEIDPDRKNYVKFNDFFGQQFAIPYSAILGISTEEQMF